MEGAAHGLLHLLKQQVGVQADWADDLNPILLLACQAFLPEHHVSKNRCDFLKDMLPQVRVTWLLSLLKGKVKLDSESSPLRQGHLALRLLKCDLAPFVAWKQLRVNGEVLKNMLGILRMVRA